MAPITEPCTSIEVRHVARGQIGVVRSMLTYLADMMDDIERSRGPAKASPDITVDQAMQVLLRKINAGTDGLSNVEALQFTQAYLNLAHAKLMMKNNQNPLIRATESVTIDDRIIGAFATIAEWSKGLTFNEDLGHKLNECLYGTDPNASP